MEPEAQGELSLVEERLWAVTKRTGLAAYDFDFGSCFAVHHPAHLPEPVVGVARLGAVEDYRPVFEAWHDRGVTFVNSPEAAMRADDLSEWYPLLADLTPRSACFDALPAARDIEASIGFPAFLKGVRQTSHHDASLAIVRSGAEYEQVRERWVADAILASQRVAARALVSLRNVRAPERANELPRSFEFRTFWWNGSLVGAGPYWLDAGGYQWSETERSAALEIAGEAAKRIDVAFLCVDVAQQADGRWIVIEINDGQRSGYAGVPRIAMWRTVIDRLRDGE